MLKEQVAKLDYMWRFCGIPDEYEAEWEKEGELVKQNCRAFAQEILNLFKAEVDKLTVIDTEERVMVMFKNRDYIKKEDGTIDRVKANICLLEAQFQHTKKELLDLTGE